MSTFTDLLVTALTRYYVKKFREQDLGYKPPKIDKVEEFKDDTPRVCSAVECYESVEPNNIIPVVYDDEKGTYALPEVQGTPVEFSEEHAAQFLGQKAIELFSVNFDTTYVRRGEVCYMIISREEVNKIERQTSIEVE